MKTLLLAAAACALLAAPAFAAPAANTTAPAEKTKAAPKYDCTKKGNANKAACKTAAAAPAATPAKPAATPAPAAKAAPAAPAAKSPAAPAATATKGESKMKTCAIQWKAMTAAQQADYKTKGAGMKSKAGKPLSGYNAFTSECMKK
jgi:translation initiation factor IF-2